MKLNLTGSGVLVAAGIAGAVVLAWWIVKNRALFNPASDKNLAYQGAGAVVSAATGGAEETVGGLFARAREWISGDDARIREMLKGAPAVRRTPAKSVLQPAPEASAEVSGIAPYFAP